MSATLPSRPQGLRLLTDTEGERLNAAHPDIPKSLAHCITCQGRKVFMWRGPDGSPVEYDCPCIDQRIMHRYFLHSGIGLRYQRLRWLDIDQGAVDMAALNRVLEYGEQAEHLVAIGAGLTLQGSAMGTGKTMMATLLLKGLLAQGIDGYFTQFNEMLDAFTETWRNAEERAWFTRRVRNAGVLVIDDVGRENAARAEVAEAMFDMVLRARHDNCKPTIITTNKTPEAFESRYRSNIMSLLSETSETIEVKGADYRPVAQGKALEEKRLGLTRPVTVG